MENLARERSHTVNNNYTPTPSVVQCSATAVGIRFDRQLLAAHVHESRRVIVYIYDTRVCMYVRAHSHCTTRSADVVVPLLWRRVYCIVLFLNERRKN